LDADDDGCCVTEPLFIQMFVDVFIVLGTNTERFITDEKKIGISWLKEGMKDWRSIV
jgi:hypothetical protein